MANWLVMPFIRYLWKSSVYSIIPLVVSVVIVWSMNSEPMLRIVDHQNWILHVTSIVLGIVFILRSIVKRRLRHNAKTDASEDSVEGVASFSKAALTFQYFVAVAQVTFFVLVAMLLRDSWEASGSETFWQFMALAIYLLSAGFIIGGMPMTRIVAHWAAYLQSNKDTPSAVTDKRLEEIAAHESWSNTLVTALLIGVLISCGYWLIGDVNLPALIIDMIGR